MILTHPRLKLLLGSLLPLLGLACALNLPEQLAPAAQIGPTPAPTVMVGPTFTPAAGVMNLPATPVPTIMPLTDTAPITRPAGVALVELPASPTSAIIDVAYLETWRADVVDQYQANFYPNDNILPAKHAVDRYQIRFRSRKESGHLVPIRAELFVPRVESPTDFPVFVYGAGTTGIGNTCAPLDEIDRGKNWGLYETHMMSYAAQGYITMLPHWQGYDDPTRTHLYFIASLEGRILLDATRVLYEFFEKAPAEVQARPAEAVFYGGYSQGGHGAFAAQDMAPDYAPELPIKGIVGHATAPDVEALLRERPPLGPYIVYAYLNYYGGEIINPEQVFQPDWLPTFYEDASTKCVDEAYDYYPNDPGLMYRPEFLDALYNNRLSEFYPGFKAALDENYVGAGGDPGVPAILLHGGADNIVTPETNERFVARLCNQGKNVTYNLYPGVNHFQTRQHSFRDSLNWMQQVTAGNLPESGCSEFFNSQFN